jgi:phosphate transport system substrate-binding protein
MSESMRNRNTKNRNLLLYGIMASCLTLFIFVLLFIQLKGKSREPKIYPTPPTPTPSPTTTPIKKNSCRPDEIQQVNVSPIQIVPFAGSTTFAPLNKLEAPLNEPEIIAIIKRAHPQFPLQYIDPAKYGETPGSGTGIKWLIRGTHNLSFAQSSRPLSDQEVQDAKDRNIKLKQQEIAYDLVAIYINPQLIKQGLKGLTLAQVRDIFTGRITNWKDVGGPYLKIAPFRRNSADSGTVKFFKENVMNNQEFGSNVASVGQKGKPEKEITTLAIRKVASTVGSISFATASEVINQDTIRILPIAKEDTPKNIVSPCTDESCKAVDTNVIANQVYPEQLTRKLFVVIKQDGGQDENAGQAYANMLKSCEGQELVRQAGFVPL